jgi:hypothetical protein
MNDFNSAGKEILIFLVAMPRTYSIHKKWESLDSVCRDETVTERRRPPGSDRELGPALSPQFVVDLIEHSEVPNEFDGLYGCRLLRIECSFLQRRMVYRDLKSSPDNCGGVRNNDAKGTLVSRNGMLTTRTGRTLPK